MPASAPSTTGAASPGEPWGATAAVVTEAADAVRDEHTAAFLRLRQLWERGTHFSLLLVAVNNPGYRDALIAQLNRLHPAVTVDLDTEGLAQAWPDALAAAWAAGTRHAHLRLPLDKRPAEVWWQRVNLLRESLADALPGVQVVWMSNAEVDTLAHQAPDLWNWRDAVLDFTLTAPAAHPPALSEPTFNPLLGQDAEVAQRRLDAIQGYLAADPPSSPATAHLRLELQALCQRLGRWQDGEAAARQAVQEFDEAGDAAHQAEARAALAWYRWKAGDGDLALKILRQQVVPVYERLGDVHSKAVALGQIADILHTRGQLDEALRIRTDEELPVFERLGDVREKTVTLGKIADILHARGQLDEALRIRTDEELPVYERLGDVRGKAVTLGQIADILHARGQLDEALRIRTDEQLPVFERLGDVREKAVTLGKIADILHARGQLDEALRIRTDEQLPVYERLGDVRGKAVTLGKIAAILHDRGQLGDALCILNNELLPVFERLGDVRGKAVALGKIADILHDRGQWDEALALHQQRLPVATALGDRGILAHIHFSLAQVMLSRGDHQHGQLPTIYEHAQQAFDFSLQAQRADFIGHTGLLLAQVLVMGGLAADAVAVLNQAEQAFQTLGSAEGVAAVQQTRQQIAQAIGPG